MVGVDERPRVVRHHRLQPGLVAGHALRLPPRPPASTTSSASSPTTSTRRRAAAGSTATASASAWRSPRARFNLLVAAGGPRRREMRYRLFAHDRAGRPVTLAGVKDVEDGWFRDTWVDTTTLFTRLYTGGSTRDEEDGATAAGHGGPARLRGRLPGPDAEHARVAARQAALRLVLHPLAAAGLRRARARHGLDRLPRPAPRLRALAGLPARGMARVPRAARACAGASWPCAPRTGATSPSTTSAATREPTEGPVLLQHGTGVRANLFYGSPMPRSIVDVLVEEGYDVWLGNWRGSIDLPECDYTLDEVARYDHPALIAAVLRETGAQTLKAIVHCQGSTSFALACAGGLVPEVTDVVSNAVSFHVDVPRLSKLQMQVLMPLLVGRLPGLRPAVDAAPDGAARAAAGHLGAHRAPRVPRARVPDGQLHLRRRRQHPLGPREPRPAHPPLDRPRVRLGADHLLPARCRAAPRRGTSSRPRGSTSCPTTSCPRRRATGRAGRSWRARPTAASCPAARSARSRGWTAWSPGATRWWSSRATRTSTSSSAATPSATSSGTSAAHCDGTSNPRGS